MNPKSVTFSIVAVAAVIVLFASGPLVASVQAFPGFGGFHHGFGFHHGSSVSGSFAFPSGWNFTTIYDLMVKNP